jgi:predicted nucleic acid-binding Zn ribbon protein
MAPSPHNHSIDCSSPSPMEGTSTKRCNKNNNNTLVFSRRSTKSHEKEVDQAEIQPITKYLSSFDVASPKGTDVHVEEHQSVVTAEDDSGSEDLEAGKEADKGRNINMKRCSSKRVMIAFFAVICFVIALTVGLVYAFHFQYANASPSHQQSNNSGIGDNALYPTTQDQEDIVSAGSHQGDNGSPSISNPLVENKPPVTDVKQTDIPPLTHPALDKFNKTTTLEDDGNGTDVTTTQPPHKYELFEWPELVGMPAKQAKHWLQEQYGKDAYDIIILDQNSPVTKDLRLNRIRLFVNDDGVIVEIPRTG